MRVIVTGSSGLVGSEAVEYFDSIADSVIGIDNNMRLDFFGDQGDTSSNLARLQRSTNNFTHIDADIRDRPRIESIFKTKPADLVIHCAGQPSHDLSRNRPVDDFEVNALGTLNLLEATRLHCPDAVFIFLSTNKVYGDAPNEIPVSELETRFDYSNPEDFDGLAETCRIDRSTHSIFGASKAAADLLVQEYGRYLGLKTACLRCGCITGPSHAGVELHGFLSFLVKVALRPDGSYKIFGYKGKQVRDNIHSYDLVRACHAIFDNPPDSAVYNMGGGRANSVSILEAISIMESNFGRKLSYQLHPNNRVGDHICYISDLSKFKTDYPGWSITKDLNTIFSELVESETTKTAGGIR